MNWSSLIFGAVLIFGLALYAVKKKHEYHGPVVLVREEERGAENISLHEMPKSV